MTAEESKKLTKEIGLYFETHIENSTEVIAKHFGLTEASCSLRIDDYLSLKKNYMGHKNERYHALMNRIAKKKANKKS